MLAGVGGGSNDSGVSDRLFGRFLSWLNDHESDVFTIGTCNDISKLSASSKGAFTRSERFDGLFFVDLPGREQKDLIWKIWMKFFDITDTVPKDPKWTGAEIRSCCRLAKLLDLSLVEAAKMVVPVAVTSEDTINDLRDFAHNRYLSADFKGVYDKNGDPEKLKLAPVEDNRLKRKVTRQTKTG